MVKPRSNIHIATLLVLHVPAYSTHLTYGYYTGVVIGLPQMILYIYLTASCLSSLFCVDDHNLLARVGNIRRKNQPSADTTEQACFILKQLN